MEPTRYTVPREMPPDSLGHYDVYSNGLYKPIDKLGQLEDIEEDLGIELQTLFKALKYGIYFLKNDKIWFSNTFIMIGKYLVQTKPCYSVKETTVNSVRYGDSKTFINVKDGHFWDWDISVSVKIIDYGKTWALTLKELENNNEKNN